MSLSVFSHGSQLSLESIYDSEKREKYIPTFIDLFRNRDLFEHFKIQLNAMIRKNTKFPEGVLSFLDDIDNNSVDVTTDNVINRFITYVLLNSKKGMSPSKNIWLFLDDNYNGITIPYGFNKHMIIYPKIKSNNLRLTTEDQDKISINKPYLLQSTIIRGVNALSLLERHFKRLVINSNTFTRSLELRKQIGGIKEIHDYDRYNIKIENIEDNIIKNATNSSSSSEISKITTNNIRKVLKRMPNKQSYNEDFIQAIKWMFVIVSEEFQKQKRPEEKVIIQRSEEMNPIEDNISFGSKMIDSKILNIFIEQIGNYIIPKDHNLSHNDIVLFRDIFINEIELQITTTRNIPISYVYIIPDKISNNIMRRFEDNLKKKNNIYSKLRLLEFSFFIRRILIERISSGEISSYILFNYVTRSKNVKKYISLELPSKSDFFNINFVQKEQNSLFTTIPVDDILAIAENMAYIGSNDLEWEQTWEYDSKSEERKKGGKKYIKGTNVSALLIDSKDEMKTINMIFSPYINSVFPRDLRLFIAMNMFSDPISMAASCYLKNFDNKGTLFWEAFILSLYSWYINKRDLERTNLKDDDNGISYGIHNIRLANGILLNVHSTFRKSQSLIRLKFHILLHPMSFLSYVITSKPHIRDRFLSKSMIESKQISFFPMDPFNKVIEFINTIINPLNKEFKTIRIGWSKTLNANDVIINDIKSLEQTIDNLERRRSKQEEEEIKDKKRILSVKRDELLKIKEKIISIRNKFKNINKSFEEKIDITFKILFDTFIEK